MRIDNYTMTPPHQSKSHKTKICHYSSSNTNKEKHEKCITISKQYPSAWIYYDNISYFLLLIDHRSSLQQANLSAHDAALPFKNVHNSNKHNLLNLHLFICLYLLSQ